MNMNRNKARALLPIITAFAYGETIQFRRIDEDRWYDDLGVHSVQDFQSDRLEYRIKPMPEEFFITVYGDAIEAVIEGGDGDDDNVGGTYRTAADARKGGQPNARVFKVTEVIA